MTPDRPDWRQQQESRPDCRVYRDHHDARIAILVELAIVARHPLVLVPLHSNLPVAAAAALAVRDRDIGKKHHLPALLPEALAPVQILAVEEVALIEQADIIQCLTADEHAGARNGVHLYGAVGQRRIDLVDAGVALAEQRRQGKQWRWFVASAAALFAAILVENAGAAHADIGVCFHESEHSLKRHGINVSIGVKEEAILGGNRCEGAVVGGGEPQVTIMTQYRKAWVGR